jgi:hypothetical protein
VGEAGRPLPDRARAKSFSMVFGWIAAVRWAVCEYQPDLNGVDMVNASLLLF